MMISSSDSLPPTPQRKVSSSSPFQTPVSERGRSQTRQSQTSANLHRSLSRQLDNYSNNYNGQRSQSRHSESSNHNDKEKGVNVQVILRCRPCNEDELRSHAPQVISCNEERREVTVFQNLATKQIDRTFTFDKVFGPKSQQRALYDQAISPIVQEVLDGYNCTVFAYGQTGTGKTYTMEGGGKMNYKNVDLPTDAGVIPRAVRQIIDTLESQQADYSMKVTFLELYNEEITDLLIPDDSSKNFEERTKRPIALMEDGKGGVLVRGLEEEIVYGATEIYSLLERGSSKRRTAETLLNKQSSRSHSIFTITVNVKEVTTEGEELIKCGKLNLVDLAGSENISRTGAREMGRVREAGEINKSLLTLGRVITSLVEHLGHVPYRDSKLTRLLRDSLGGKTKTCIIATVSPSVQSLEETLSTLDYASRAKSIKNKPEVNQKLLKSVLMKDLYSDIERLKQEVRAAREKNGVYLPRERYIQEEAEKKAMTEKIDKIEFDLDSKNKHIEEIQNILNVEKETNSQLMRTLDTTQEKLVESKEALKYSKEQNEQANWTIKEKEFIISNLLETEKSLLERAAELRSDLEKTATDVDGLFAKIDRKSKIENGNHALVQTFQSQLSQHLEVLHCSILDSISQQQQQLIYLELQLHSFLALKDKDTNTLKDMVEKMKTTYLSKVKDLHVLANTMEEKTTSTLENLNSEASNHSSTLLNVLATSVSQADTMLAELQNTLAKQGDKTTSFVWRQQEGMKRTIDSTREISRVIVDFFEGLDKHAVSLNSYIEESQTASIKKLEELEKSYQVSAAFEQKQMVEKIAEIIASSTNKNIQLMQRGVSSIRDGTTDRTHELQQGMSGMQQLASNAQKQWHGYVKQAEEKFLQDNSLTESGHQDLKEILNESTTKVTTIGKHWGNAQADLQQLESRNVEVVEQTVKSGTEMSRLLLADISTTVDSANTENRVASQNLLVAINDSLKVDLETCEVIQPVIAKCNNNLEELKSSHHGKVSLMTVESNKYLQEDYMNDQPTCTTPRARNISVPSHESIAELRTPSFEELLEKFQSEKSENRLHLSNGEVKHYHSNGQGEAKHANGEETMSLKDGRPPLTAIN